MLMMGGGYRRRRGNFNPLVAMGVGFTFVLIMGLGKASTAMGAAAIPIWLAAIAGAVFVLRGPVGEAILHSAAGRDREEDPDAIAATDPGVLQDLDDLRTQVAELQERVDFTERLLAREREARPLGTGERP